MAKETSRKESNTSKLPDQRTVMRISLIISLLFHVIVLFSVQKAFPISWMKPLRTYHVELLRPPVDSLYDEQAAGTNLASIKPQEKKAPEKTEDTISLDTKDKRYVSYAKVIKERLMQHWEYPRKARDNLIEGQVLVIFSLDRQGNLKDVKILMPSAYAILDEETERAIRASAPFPPFPGSVTVRKLNIKANFAYVLKTRRP
jgi:TonB family protein